MGDFFADTEQHRPAWLDAHGPAADIVLATRARMARNLGSFPFPHHASEVELGTILGDLFRRLGKVPSLQDAWFLSLDELTPGQRRLLQELHLASPGLLQDPRHRGLVVASDLTRSVMVNEEDHLRLQAYRPGFDPQGTLEDVLTLDGQVEQEVGVAFDSELGYLTACPANVGTGLRLSVLFHLPGLVLAGEIDKVLNALRQLQFNVQGLFGRGSTVRGDLFQVSNLVTLGWDESEVASDFAFHVGKVLLHERNAREQLHAADRQGIEDMVHRSLAALRSARLITSQETFDRLSQVRLGVSLGLLPGLSLGLLNRALVLHQTAHLELIQGHPLSGRDKSAVRADVLRGLLAADGDNPG